MNKQFTLTALVISSITVDLITVQLNIQEWTQLNNIQLADPLFHVPKK